MKNILAFVGLLMLSLIFTDVASAHAVVTPKIANVAEFVNFSLGVPSEKAFATTKVELSLPEGLNFVTPFVKPGWKIEVAKTGDVKTKITWSGGNIPTEQKDQFMFSAQVPKTLTTLKWNVIQTYSNGTTVTWDQEPSYAGSFDSKGPYSQTQVINDLATPNTHPTQPSNNQANIALVISVISLVFSLNLFRKNNQQ